MRVSGLLLAAQMILPLYVAVSTSSYLSAFF